MDEGIINMDKHLIADNPMSDNGTIAIIRTLQPISIYEVIEGHVEAKNHHRHYTIMNGDGEIEKYTLRVHQYFTTDIDTLDENEVFKFMDDAWHYFRAYINFEDENL